MTDESQFDRYQLGQKIRFLAHMLSVAMKSKNPDIKKKKEEHKELKEYLNSWKAEGLPDNPDILWAEGLADQFTNWLKDPKSIIVRPVNDLPKSHATDLDSIIRERRSVRYWTKDPVPKKAIDKILEAGIYAPSAFNRLPWRFFVAMTPFDQLEEGDASNPGMFRQAPVRIFVTIDERLFFEKYSGALDAGLAMQNMLLTAHNLGLGTCLIYQGEFVDKKILKEHYKIPDYCNTYCALLLGYPNEIPETPARMPLEEAVEYLGEVPNPDF